MSNREREFIASPWRQGEDEARPYVWDVSSWGFTAVDSAAVALKNVTNPDAVTDASDLISGSAGIDGTTVTTGVVSGLTAGQIYRLEIKVTQGSRTEEAWGLIMAEV